MRDWLKRIREDKGLTQAETAKIAGISQNYYSNIEIGERGDKLPVPTAKKIADALGFDWMQFYDNEPSKAEPA